ncbi:hypothetical protein CIK65_04645 [Brevibacterium aurantiacum]|uniref:RiboL-PSP-HEPN domain-containing protein n=1 Tax=Brevibacterium aurantiacum TaxID=273384 RepID=A0A2A3YX71_BREAU|nr:hypothetical protein CIK65_04645 [Brevibacterium aurantiacum]
MRVDSRIGIDGELVVGVLSQMSCTSDRREGAIVGAIATVEAYVDATVKRLIDMDSRTRSQLGNYLIDQYISELSRNWKSRHSVLRDGFGVFVESESVAQNLKIVVDVRNALMHGDGKLTDLQSAKWKSVVALRRDMANRLDIELQGRRLVLGEDSVKLACSILIEYVLQLERSIYARKLRG